MIPNFKDALQRMVDINLPSPEQLERFATPEEPKTDPDETKIDIEIIVDGKRVI